MPPLSPSDGQGPKPEARASVAAGPVSAFVGAIDGLIRNRNLAPPTHPGALAALERFEVLQLIGAGGMGLVFLARDPQNGAKVAIKMLKPELVVQLQAVHRFLVEVRHLRRLQHPGILGILEVFERKEGPFFVMPFLEKGSLADLIQPGRPLETPVILRIAGQIATALQYAHGKGIIHHDLKPANILLDNEGNAFLTDFGLARTMFNDSFVDIDRGHCEGTAPYMSPAVAAGQAEDTRCDIYAFGALLYEMLTGRPPYQGATAAEVLEKIRRGPPPPISDLNLAAPPELVAVASGAMARTQRDRYASMADIVADLQRIEDGQPPLGPHGQWKAPRRWPSLLRRRPLAAASVALLAFLLGGAGWWFQPRLVSVTAFSSAKVPSWNEAKLGDWDGDKRPEIFVSDGRRCLAFASGGELEAQFAPAEGVTNDLRVTLVADINHDAKDDVFLSWAGGGRSYLAAYNRYKFELVRWSILEEGPIHPYQGRIHTGLDACRLSDLNHDGTLVLLAGAATSWGRARGLYCFDSLSAAQLWHCPTAPNVAGMALIDVEGDGKDDVVFGSEAVSNGIKRNDGTDDGHCYLYAVSSKGALLWRTELGDTYCRCSPLVIVWPSRKPRLYAHVHASRYSRLTAGKEEIGRVVQLDIKGREVARYDAGDCLRSCLADDLDGDGRPELLVTDWHGVLHILDPDLRLLAKRNITPDLFSHVDLCLVAVTNLTGGTAKQLIFTSYQVEVLSADNVGNNLTNVNVFFAHHCSVQVWDSSLRRVAQWELAKSLKEEPRWSVRVADWDGDGIPEIISMGKEVRVLKLKRGFQRSEKAAAP